VQEYVLHEGQPPYHPRDLAGLYLYGMLNRIRSSRQLEAATWNRLDVIWLLQGQHPDHATIAAFVTRHGAVLRRLLRDTATVGLRAGLVKLEHTAGDGTKIEADAGRGSVRSAEKIGAWLGHLDKQLAALEAEWQNNEQREPQWLGGAAPWAPRAERSPTRQVAAMKRKQARLRAALTQIERRQAEAAAGGGSCRAIGSTTDPASRCMKDKEGRSKPNFNAQLAVDTAPAGMIVATEVNDAPEDTGQLTPLLAQVAANCGRLPAAASADSGYNTGPELAALEAQGVTGYLPDAQAASAPAEATVEAATAEAAAVAAVQAGQELTAAQWSALPQDAAGRITKAAFAYDAAADAYRCPAGFSLPLLAKNCERRKWGTALRSRYGFTPYGRGAKPRGAVPCAGCPHAPRCCADPAQGRRLERDQYEAQRERLRARMNTAEGRAIYRRRRETVEPRFGWIKQGLGVRRFLRRGLEKVRTEWALVATAVNVSILLRHWELVRPVL
jgi:transposase